ncbi:kinase-like domain-containing protein [Infundibulicybe gibba]|nr:kinase-like domain-containing protein [Infundibulicybe gibba]
MESKLGPHIDGDLPRHISAQISLNKYILMKISGALKGDPGADLTVLLSDLNTSYPMKRKKATEQLPPIRKPRASGHLGSCEGVITPLSSPSLEIFYPLAPAALAALSLPGSSSETVIEATLKQLPKVLEHGETLHKLFRRQIVALGVDVVVKCGPDVDPAEHCLLEYLKLHRPSLGSPEPLGFVVLDNTRYFFMTRIPGVTLHSRWPSLTVVQKECVCATLDAILSDLHSIPWTPGVPLGSLAAPYTCKDTRRHVRTSGPIYSEAEFNDFLLCDPLPRISSSYLKWLRSCLRDDHCIVLSHGDLNPRNIILRDEQGGGVVVSGIVDWEMGGWYPEYWDAVKALNIRSTGDESDWWCSLPEQLSRYTSEVGIDGIIETCTRV